MQTTRLCTLAEFLNHHHVFALHAAIAQFSDGSVGVSHQALFVGRISPRTCHHACAVSGTDLVLVRVNQRIEGHPIHQALFTERFERFHAQREVRRNRLVLVFVVMFLLFGDIGCHRKIAAI